MATRRKPSENFTGITLDQWHASVDNITWAQQSREYRMMLSVVLNESHLAHQSAAGCSEGRGFGRVEGYHMAMEVLRSLGKKPSKIPIPPAETFDETSQHTFKAQEPLD